MSRILVIDDDSLQRATLRVALERMGHRVSLAANGREALQVMDQDGEKPALVITDMVMPEMDGLEVVHHFRKHHAEVPIVAISGEVPESFLQLAMRLGARMGLTKPLDMPQFMASVEDLLSKG
ncbi:MAG: response regulator [Firmicutes bacterium]|nr:response regulator [Bacillota bacterium]